MKKLISLALALVMTAGIFALVPMPVTAADATPGTAAVGRVGAGYTPVGTAVTTAEQFAAMEAGGNYYLDADITIGASYTTAFTGVFDGNGHTVTISAPMFAEFAGTAKNLVIEGSVTNTNAATIVAGTAATEEVRAAVVGAFAVLGDGTFTNMANKAALSGKSAIGGLVGFIPTEATFTDCVNTAKITYTGADGQWNAIGGISGTTIGNTEYVNCVNTGVIDCGGNKVPAGGIAGTGNSNTKTLSTATMTLKDCVNTAEVKGGWQTGGIVGWAARTSLVLENCKNTANVSSSQSYAAGIVARSGEKNTIAIGCVNEGDISSSTSHSGGIISLVDVAEENKNTVIKDCYNKGKIIAENKAGNLFLGGIVGYLKGVTANIVNCVNDGEVYAHSTAGNAYVAGIVGVVGEGTGIKYITDCVNKAYISGKGKGNVRAGGIVGNLNMLSTQDDRKTEINGCLNNGVIEGRKTADGTKNPSVGGIVGWAEFSATIKNCTNTAEIKSDYAAGGIIGKGYRGIYYVEYCINTANITGTSQVAGISGAFDPGKNAGTYYQSHVSYCGNYGNINGNSNVAGILGYQYGTKVAYSIIDGCYTIGDINAKSGHASGIIAYLNTVNVEVRNCFGTGKVTGKTSSNAILFNNKEISEKIENNYFTEGYATNWIAQGLNATPSNPETPFTPNLTVDELESGKLAFNLNEAIKKRVFYQDLGVDAAPTVDRTHAPVNKYGDRYFNIREGGASVRAVGASATVGVRFRSLIAKEVFDEMKDEVAEIGVIIAPKAVADAAGEMTFEALEAYKTASGKTNVYAALKRSGDYAAAFSTEELKDGSYEIKGSLVNVKNAAMEFTAVGYVKLTDGRVFYGSTDTNSAKAIAQAAVADTKGAAEAGYPYEVKPGVFSPYTKEAYESLETLAK